jgi:perosamine synthetase
MNQQPCLQKIKGFRTVPCPIADKLWEQGFYLPSSYTLSEEKIRFIAECIKNATTD